MERNESGDASPHSKTFVVAVRIHEKEGGFALCMLRVFFLPH